MSARKKTKAIPTEKEMFTVPLDWRIPEGVATPFATNMLVQLLENEFKIMFFEVNPPIRLDVSDPAPNRVSANCVASVIISADRLPKFIAAIQKQLDRYNVLKEKGQLPGLINIGP